MKSSFTGLFIRPELLERHLRVKQRSSRHELVQTAPDCALVATNDVDIFGFMPEIDPIP